MKVALKSTFKASDNATSPVFGAMLIILLTFVLAVATVAAVYNDDAIERITNSLTKTPAAVIDTKIIENYGSSYRDIDIKIWHKGGDSLTLDSTFIVLSGKGISQIGVFGFPGFKKESGDITVKYTNLAYDGKRQEKYIDTNTAALGDGVWSTGEQLILNGEDSSSGINTSTVLVTVNGISSDYDNYGFKSGTTVTIKIFDKTTKRIIAQGTAVVKPAE